jgi:predicted phosphodiesterase
MTRKNEPLEERVAPNYRLRLAADFWAEYKACSENVAEMSRRHGLPRTTLKDWKEHHEAKDVWVAGGWLPAVTAQALAVEADGLPDRIKVHLRRSQTRQTVEEIADQFGVCPRQVREAIASLEGDCVLLDRSGDSVLLERDMSPHEIPLTIDFTKYRETEVPIGVVADQHIGSKYERMDVLESIFDRFASYGVQTVYQCGNIIDGEARFNKFDIYVHGVEDQISNLIQKWPQRPGMTTHFVTADDHEGWYVQREHIYIGRRIEQDAYAAGRDDLRHLGYMERDIEYKQEGGSSRVRIMHAGGGSTYATSYTSQKYVESLQGGDKPQIVFVGHFHKFDYSYPRNVHIIQPGTTEDQTPFMRKKRIEAHVGGCVFWVKQNEIGIFTSVKIEWLPYYDKRFYEFKW